MDENKINLAFFAPLTKIEKGQDHKKGEVIDVLIGGCISDNSKDGDGHIMNQAGLQVDYFKSHGVIKWEHGDSPLQIIGFPIEVTQKNGKTDFVGRIFAKSNTPQFKVAEQAIGILDNVAEWNARYPEQKKEVGYSIEGYGLKTGDVITKSFITNVVLTTNPKNTNSFAIMYKSFVAGNSNDPGNMTGSQAGRKQFIAGNSKKLTIGDIPMKFNNKEECIKFYKSKGYTDEEANEQGAKWESLTNGRKTKSEDLNSKIEKIQKSFNKITEDISKLGVEDSEFVAIEKSFTTAFAVNEQGEANPLAIFKVITDSNIKLFKSHNNDSKILMTALAEIASGIKEVFEFQKSFNADIEAIQDITDGISGEQVEIVKGLNRMAGSKVFDDIKDLNVAGAGDDAAAAAAAAAAAGDKPKYTPTQVAVALKKSFEDCKEEDGDNSSVILDMNMHAEARNFSFKHLKPEVQAKVDEFYLANTK